MLSEDQAQVRDMVRRFADEVIRPVAGELDESERFPAEIYEQMAELGLFGITVPAEHGRRRHRHARLCAGDGGAVAAAMPRSPTSAAWSS